MREYIRHKVSKSSERTYLRQSDLRPRCDQIRFWPFSDLDLDLWPNHSQKLIDCSLGHDQSSHQISVDSVQYFLRPKMSFFTFLWPWPWPLTQSFPKTNRLFLGSWPIIPPNFSRFRPVLSERKNVVFDLFVTLTLTF